jgi:hypothetical protein
MLKRISPRKLLVASAGVATLVVTNTNCAGTPTTGNLMAPPPCIDSVRSYYTHACVEACEPGTAFNELYDQCMPTDAAVSDAAVSDAAVSDASNPDAGDGG